MGCLVEMKAVSSPACGKGSHTLLKGSVPFKIGLVASLIADLTSVQAQCHYPHVHMQASMHTMI